MFLLVQVGQNGYLYNFFLSKLIKCCGQIYHFAKGESTKDFDFPFNYNNVKNINFSAITRASDNGIVPSFHIYIHNEKLRIIPFFNNNIYTVNVSLDVNVLFTYSSK